MPTMTPPKTTPSPKPAGKASRKAIAKTKVPPPVVGADPNAPKLTRDLLRRLHYLNTERKRLESEARSLQAEENQLRDVAFAWLEDRGLNTVRKFGFRLSQKIGRVNVKWQEAYLRLAGAEAAAKLKADSPHSITLEILQEEG